MTIDVGLLMTIVQSVGTLLIIPLTTALWSIQGRLSNIEGVLHGLEKNGKGN